MLTVIVPTYNERENIERLIGRISSLLREKDIPFEVLVMDDSSPDGTADVVGSIKDRFPEARCIVRTADRGLSPSVVQGFKESRGDIMLVMDADLSHPPEVVPQLYKAIVDDGADIAVGSRHTKGGGIENWPVGRRIISWGASLLARPLTACSDPMSGFFALRREVVHEAPLKAKGYKILLEVLVKGNDRKLREVAITFRDREAGESKLGSRVIVNYLQHLLRLYLFPGSAPLFKFLIVGTSGFIVDEGLFSLMLYSLGKDGNVIWQGLSFSAAVVWNFVWNRVWTFKATEGRGLTQFMKFAGVAVVAFAIRTGLYEVGKTALGLDTRPELIVLLFFVIGIVTFINYIGSRFWAFSRSKKD